MSCQIQQPVVRQRFLLLLSFLVLSTVLTACALSSYTVDGYVNARAGRYTRNADALAQVERVAIAALYGRSQGDADGAMLAPVMQVLYDQAKTEMSGQGTLEFVSAEDAAADPAYLERSLGDLPMDSYSPISSLTDLGSDTDISAICESLGVDALLFIRVEFDWEFPTWNAANFLYREEAFLMTGATDEIVWQMPWSPQTEVLVSLPSDLGRFAGATLSSEGWEIVMEATAETPQVKSLGGSPIYFLVDDLLAARGDG